LLAHRVRKYRLGSVQRVTSAVVSALDSLSRLEGVASGFASARDGIDALLRDRGLRRTPPERTGESLLLGAHASAVLEGSVSTLEQVRGGSGDDVAAAAVRLSTELLTWAPTLATSPLQVLARLHTLAGAAALPDEELGRPRDSASAARLRGVAEVVSVGPEVPALVVAAIAHADLVAAAPFASHNGLIARAVERLVLVARGVDPTSLVVPEAGHLANRAAYESNLRGYRDGGAAGVHAWLLYAAEAYASGAEASPVARA
jgi:hypothetical protein